MVCMLLVHTFGFLLCRKHLSLIAAQVKTMLACLLLSVIEGLAKTKHAHKSTVYVQYY